MRTHSLLAALLAGLLGVACATRTNLPPSGADSPLSPAHRGGATPRVTLALDEDPPLPGAPQGEWTGLDPEDPDAQHGVPSDAGVDPHAHHHGGAHAH